MWGHNLGGCKGKTNLYLTLNRYHRLTLFFNSSENCMLRIMCWPCIQCKHCGNTQAHSGLGVQNGCREQGRKRNRFNQRGKPESVSFWAAQLGTGFFVPAGKVTVDLILLLFMLFWIRTANIGVSEVYSTNQIPWEVRVFFSFLV